MPLSPGQVPPLGRSEAVSILFGNVPGSQLNSDGHAGPLEKGVTFNLGNEVDVSLQEGVVEEHLLIRAVDKKCLALREALFLLP